jgi:hypothetical protein
MWLISSLQRLSYANGAATSGPPAVVCLQGNEGSIRKYLSSIFTKPGMTDRTQAAVIELWHG